MNGLSRTKGAGRLYHYMVDQARYRDRVYFCADQTAANALGVNRRTILRWRCQLEQAGWIIRDGTHRWKPLCETVVYRFPPGQRRRASKPNVTQRTSCRTPHPRTASSVRACSRNLGSSRVGRSHRMSERQQDLAWEALVRETAANPAVERGVLNAALRGIREAAFTEGLTEDGLPEEIRLRAAAYRRTFPGLTMTPMALAKHWFRVMVVPPARESLPDQLRRLQETER